MAGLTEKQLLLLDNLMYYNPSESLDGLTAHQIAGRILSDCESSRKSMFSGGISRSQAKEIADAIQSDSAFKDLRLVNSINDNYPSGNPQPVRAGCFQDGDGQAVIAVRGTGGSYDAWQDNIEAALDPSTDCQEALRTYVHEQGQRLINEQGESFSGITITGHSKGGNMAQYATILEGKYIRKCVSFDGQGFDHQFILAHADDIARNSDKIKSICGKDDYVNILLDSVAGETVYLDAEGHSSFSLWDRNRNCETEVFTDDVEQSFGMKLLNFVSLNLESLLVFSLPWTREAIVGVLGSLVGTVMSLSSGRILTQEEWIDLIVNELKALGGIPAWVIDKIVDLVREWMKQNGISQGKTGSQGQRTGSGHASGDMADSSGTSVYRLEVNKKAGKSVFRKLGSIDKTIEQICAAVSETGDGICLNDEADAIIRSKIKTICKNLKKINKSISMLETAGIGCMDLYSDTEKSICSKL